MAIRQTQPKLLRISSKRKKLEQDLEHITQEMYRRNKELADTNRTLSLLRVIDSLVLESHDTVKVLSRQITQAISSATAYPLVAIFGHSSLGTDKLEIYGISTASGITVDDKVLHTLKPTARHPWYKTPNRHQLISLAHTELREIAHFLGCPAETAEILKNSLPVKSIYVTKLVARQKLVGIMVIASPEPLSDFDKSEEALLERLSEAVGIALDNKLLFEDNQQMVNQLKRANTRLKQLDRSKDEFISMASHQLRTPLTSIKGYLSMVLEGDAGKLTKTEKEMIHHAFDGAERMVFLIGDLLNISRLQSGKFVIENKATDLAKLVGGEVEQLQDIAKNHKLTLSYKKPDKFPILNLDETKVRQVIMNFMDNAIFYTPAGGSIEVELAASDDSVSYTVTDTGLGVPAADQHHLFTKFYRGGNARKMRPDGTGLGLFMAKKVIAAQGGSIIFKSTEGKGSTFGFSIPRKGLEVKKA